MNFQNYSEIQNFYENSEFSRKSDVYRKKETNQHFEKKSKINCNSTDLLQDRTGAHYHTGAHRDSNLAPTHTKKTLKQTRHNQVPRFGDSSRDRDSWTRSLNVRRVPDWEEGEGCGATFESINC